MNSSRTFLSRLRRASLLHHFLVVIVGVQLLAPPNLRAAGVSTAVVVRSAYDGNGNVTSRTDGNGAVTGYTFDSVNRLTSIDYPGGSASDVSFLFDANGNTTSMTDPTGTTTFQYDNYDRLRQVDFPDSGFVIYGYDNVGNITTRIYGNRKGLGKGQDSTHIQYTFDADNRISSVTNVKTNTTTTYTYDDSGHPLKRTLPNGVTTDYGYDGDGRLLSVDHKKSDGTRICKYTYTLDAIGNRTQVVETLPDASTKTTSYTYDPLDRLSSATYPANATYPSGRSVSYLYDSFGNRTKMTEITGATTKVTDYVYDNDSRLLSTQVNSVANETFSYDTIGNLVQRVRASDNRQIDYLYDAENRLVRYYDGTKNVQYVYNGLGVRVAKIANGLRTNFVNDLNRDFFQVLYETDSNGYAERIYEWGNELLNQQMGSNRSFHLTDSLNGSVRRIIDLSGAILNNYEYDAFGGTIVSIEQTSNRYKYNEEALEDESDLLFLRARFLDIGLGRFITRDPRNRGLSSPTSFNAYNFAEGNPVNRVDQSGQSSNPKDSFEQRFIDEWATNGETAGRYAEYGLALYGGATTLRSAIRLLGEAEASGAAVQSARIWGHDPMPLVKDVMLKQTEGAMIDYVEDKILDAATFIPKTIGIGVAAGIKPYEDDILSFLGYTWPEPSVGRQGNKNNVGTFNLFGAISDFFEDPGGVALDKSASVLLEINNITGGIYDQATGQIILYGKKDTATMALPKMSLDDLAVVARAKQLGSFPMVSIEDPIVNNPPEWPGRQCATVRYGPFYQDSVDGQTKVLDLTSNTHAGWVMAEADRHMKALGLGKDNRSLAPVSSSVPGYKNMVTLALQYLRGGNITNRFWFNPKEIVVQPSADGKSMEITKAEMQVSTEAAFASNGQVEGTQDAQYFAAWFTNNYDAIAEEQVVMDGAGQPHKIYKELKQLAYLAGVVKWISDNNIPLDLSFLKDYQPTPYPEAPRVTPVTTVSRFQNFGGGVSITVSITGGVDFCNDLSIGTGGNPTAAASAALTARPNENTLGWSYGYAGNIYNATAVSLDRTEKAGNFSPSAADATFKVNGSMPLTLGRYFDSFNVNRTMFGYGWSAQPYALAFKGSRETFSICHQTFSGYGEVWFVDRASGRGYKYIPSGTYNRVTDSLNLASRFATGQEILFYSYESKVNPGLLYSDNKTRMTLRLSSGDLLDFNLDGELTQTEDRNGNRIDYTYDANKRLTGISQAGVKSITLNYDAQNRVSNASLPGSRTVTYSYDANSNLISAQADAPTGRISRYSYDASHNLLQVQDEAGNAVATRNYDVYGRVTSTTQPGVTMPFIQTYSLANRIAQSSGPAGMNSTTEYDTKGNPIRVTDSRNNTTRNTFNIFRDLTSTTTPDGRKWSYFVDDSGNRVATVMPNGRADRATYNEFGRPLATFQGPVDAVFNAAFDSDRRMIDTNATRFTENFTQYGYDARGNLTSVTNANNQVKTFTFDAKGNMTISRDARNKPTTMTYDANSRLTRVRDPLGHQVDMTYDGRDNLVQIATLAGTSDYGYNVKNQLTNVTTGNVGARRTTNYAYDAKGNLTTVTDPNSKVTLYTYDARGNLTEIRHDGIVRFTYEYDDANRLVATRYTGTAGGARATITPLSPVGNEKFRDLSVLPITWATQGDWSGNTNVTIQYSTNGTSWTNIATVSAASGSYNWTTPVLSNTIRIRFVRTGDATFRLSTTLPFSQAVSAKYYVNDASTTGDQYCTAAGRVYNAATVNGRTPSTPVTDPQAIIDNYVLQPGDTIYIDTGNYSFNHDIQLTEADSGQRDLPITIQGAVAPGVTSISRISAASGDAVIAVFHTNSTVTPALEGIVLKNINVQGGHYGFLLLNASYCSVLNCQAHHNGLNATTAGTSGSGSGIAFAGGGSLVINSNKCYSNGGNGAAGATEGQNGGDGSGLGILNQQSSNSTISNNDCFANGGLGAAGGGSTGLAGVSRFTQIEVNGSFRDCVVRGNTVRDTIATGYSATGSGAAGTGYVTGIRLADGEDHRILNNRVYGFNATGGNSASQKGGQGFTQGIYAQNTLTPTIAANVIFNNTAQGGLGTTTSSTLRNGEADAMGIWCSSVTDAVVINNLAYDNSATAFNQRGSELPGQPYAGGLYADGSTGLRINNNTFYRNRITLSGGGVVDDQSGQIFLSNTSSGASVMNNICVSFDYYSPALGVDSTSQSGFTSNFNDLLNQGGNIGVWGNTFHSSLAAWRTGTAQDANSLSVDPGFFDSAANNYHLKSTSVLIDAGVSVPDTSDDVDGEARPAAGPSTTSVPNFDIGYDEYVDSDNDSLPSSLELSLYLTNPNDADSDDDGLPDGWEIANNLNPLLTTGIHGTSGDADGDGYSNFAEFQAGTDPRSTSSVPSTPLSPWQDWQKRSFTATEASNALISGDLADPDRDGITNLMEYQLGTDPKAGTFRAVNGFIPGLPRITLDGNTLAILYHRDLSKTDLISNPQWSGDLQAWNSTGFTELIQATSGNVQLVKATIPKGTAKWLRLRCYRGGNPSVNPDLPLPTPSPTPN